jgi:hypothetical protein
MQPERELNLQSAFSAALAVFYVAKIVSFLRIFA